MKKKTPMTEKEAILHDFEVFKIREMKQLEKMRKFQGDLKNDDNSAILKAESRIQQECCAWYRNTFCLKHHNPRCMIFSIPNESNEAKAAQLINTGLYPGAADLPIIHAVRYFDGASNTYMGYEYKLVFIEIKTPENRTGPKKNGQSKKQIEFEEHCKQMGIPYFLVRSKEEFCQVVESL